MAFKLLKYTWLFMEPPCKNEMPSSHYHGSVENDAIVKETSLGGKPLSTIVVIGGRLSGPNNESIASTQPLEKKDAPGYLPTQRSLGFSSAMWLALVGWLVGWLLGWSYIRLEAHVVCSPTFLDLRLFDADGKKWKIFSQNGGEHGDFTRVQSNKSPQKNRSKLFPTKKNSKKIPWEG